MASQQRVSREHSIWDAAQVCHPQCKDLRQASGDAFSLSGQVTELLPPYFSHVTGTDPSEGMIQQAKEQARNSKYQSQLDFLVCPAEEVSSKVEAKVDLVTAGQAVHWFDHTKIWKELAKILKPGGTAAFWTYSEFRVAGHPELTPLINAYAHSDDSLGPHWQQPGRRILENHLQEVAFPTSGSGWDLATSRRIYFAGNHVPELDLPFHHIPGEEDSKGIVLPADRDFKTDVILKKTWTWDGLQSYLRTFSSLHAYHEAHPEDRNNQGGDIVERMIQSMKKKVPNAERLDVEWPVTLLLIKKDHS